jgi:hypothetical protein
VTIRDVPAAPVAIMEHRGDPATLGATIQRFIAWRKAAGLHPKTSPTFTVWRSERRPASPAQAFLQRAQPLGNQACAECPAMPARLYGCQNVAPINS